MGADHDLSSVGLDWSIDLRLSALYENFYVLSIAHIYQLDISLRSSLIPCAVLVCRRLIMMS